MKESSAGSGGQHLSTFEKNSGSFSENEVYLVSVLPNNEVIFFNNIEKDFMKYTYFSKMVDNKYQDNKCELSEQTFFKFQYPYLIMIKGSLELIIYSFINNIFYYEKLNCPVLMGIENALDNASNRNDAYVLLDAGPFFAALKITP